MACLLGVSIHQSWSQVARFASSLDYKRTANINYSRRWGLACWLNEWYRLCKHWLHLRLNLWIRMELWRNLTKLSYLVWLGLIVIGHLLWARVHCIVHRCANYHVATIFKRVRLRRVDNRDIVFLRLVHYFILCFFDIVLALLIILVPLERL